MEATKILIVEDELIEAQGMHDTLVSRGYQITGLATSEAEALTCIKENKPDLVLMDIKLNEGTEGISAAKKIRIIHSLPIIFITHLLSEETFDEAREAFPQNYITKPYNDFELIRSVELALQNTANEIKPRTQKLVTDGVFIPLGNTKTKLFFNDILHIEAEGSYSKIYIEPKEGKINHVKVSLNAKSLIEQMACSDIVKIHRSHYVNIQKVDKVSKDFVFIKDREISIGPEYYNKTLKKITTFISSNLH